MYKLTQMHIEAARNSTDDFNLFHDKLRWNLIKGNPFEGPIALGFQLGCFVETQVDHLRSQAHQDDLTVIKDNQLNISGYDFSFAGCVKPEQSISLNLKKGRLKTLGNETQLSSRLMVLCDKKPAIIGYKRECNQFPDLFPFEFPALNSVDGLADRSFVNNQDFFVKHKYMILGNAKNFLNSAFAEQSEYIDEFEDKISFPQMYPLGLLSSALLERAQADGHDLKLDPMIYVSHHLYIDKQQLLLLKSNDKLVIVVSKATPKQDTEQDIRSHYCLAYAPCGAILYKAQVDLMPLSEVLKHS
jgi:hypothetical protein